MSNEIVKLIQFAASCIEDAAREAGDMGAPSGVVFAAFSAQGMTLGVYQQIIDAMVRAGRITVSNNLIRIAQGA